MIYRLDPTARQTEHVIWQAQVSVREAWAAVAALVDALQRAGVAA